MHTFNLQQAIKPFEFVDIQSPLFSIVHYRHPHQMILGIMDCKHNEAKHIDFSTSKTNRNNLLGKLIQSC